MTAHAVPHIELPGIALPGDEVFERVAKGLREGKGALRHARDKVIDFMAGFSDAQELVVLDSVFGDGSTNLNTAPTYLALTTVAVTESMTGATITEATYTGYARCSIAAADVSAAAAGSKTNGNALTFANCTSGTSTIIGWAVCTTSGSGTGAVIVYGTCTSTVISTTQTPATVAAGGLVVTLD